MGAILVLALMVGALAATGIVVGACLVLAVLCALVARRKVRTITTAAGS
jgi:hypothetical protein